MRDCRSTYWPVTSVAFVVRSEVLPSAWACCSTVAKSSTGTCSVMVPDGVLPVAAPDCVCELATKPPDAPASEVSRVMVRPRSPRPTDNPRVPVCSILDGWPTAPAGSVGGTVGVVTAGVDAACPAPADGDATGALAAPPATA